jgi:copper chaperone NosL
LFKQLNMRASAMRTASRIVLVVSGILLGIGLVTPLWRITLKAPQYPEGVQMYIWATRLSGQVELINGLNHYIGMRPIREEDFPEFAVMPWVLGGLGVLAVVAAVLNRRGLALTWAILLLLATVVGLADFYRWGYEYGHNLDPRAPIKVPGMSYQPPLIGSKQLLNFTAYSYPDLGGWAAFAALIVGGGVAVGECIGARRRRLARFELRQHTREPLLV